MDAVDPRGHRDRLRRVSIRLSVVPSIVTVELEHPEPAGFAGLGEPKRLE